LRPSRATEASHVAFLIDAVFPFDIGGRQTYIYQVARRLAAEGRNVDVYTMNWWKGPRSLHIDGVTFHALCRLHPSMRASGDPRSKPSPSGSRVFDSSLDGSTS